MAFVLLAVMLLASFLPCADAKSFGPSEETNIATVKAAQHGSQFEDLCSPFCSCQCCSVVTIYHSFQTALTPEIRYHQLYIFQPAPAVIQKLHDIWRPPQV